MTQADVPGDKLKKILEIRGKRFLFKVETSDFPENYVKYEELRNEIWGFPEDNLAGYRNMFCENFLHEGSSLFIPVYAEDHDRGFREDKDRLVGFAYGFVGIKDKEIAFRSSDNFRFYSQFTGVRPDFRGCGLGRLIKEFQKEIVMDVFGIRTMTCTYDPLTGINAYRNIHLLDMEVLEYRTALYGEYGGLLNRRDVPSDRFFMSWDLTKEHRKPVYDLDVLLDPRLRVIEVRLQEVRGRSGPLTLEIAGDIHFPIDGNFLLVPVPRDFYLMLGETDVEEQEIRNIPIDWRLKTRRVFRDLFDRGFRVLDFRKIDKNGMKNLYVLQK